MQGVIGIDIGGTFTDLIAATEDGQLHIVKVPSTSEDFSVGFMQGLESLTKLASLMPEEIKSVAHGTTIATNAILEHNWYPIGLLVTQGYREMLEIARQTVPGDWGEIYIWLKPPRIVPQDDVLEIKGRMTMDGEELIPLDEEDVRAAAEQFKRKGIRAVAISFIHSYRNPRHEIEAGKIFHEVYPECHMTLSSEILPEFREYERTSTTCMNAILMPLIDEYVVKLKKELDGAGYSCPLYLMKSVGGLSTHEKLLPQPIYTAGSGPGAGVLGMAWLSQQIGEAKVLTFDMGGTSTDVALVENGVPLVTTERLIDVYPVKAPAIGVVSIGAGGGSIATLGTGGRLRVGPESAGADPGPVCYGRGNTEPTVTDANLVLGRIPESLLGGEIAIDAEAAASAISRLGEKLGLDTPRMADGILEIAVFNMAGAVREVTVRKGKDPRDYTMFAYGGAGPLHAAQVAHVLGISRIVIPPSPGLGSALGMLAADIKETHVLTHVVKESEVNFEWLNAKFREMESDMRSTVAEEGVEEKDIAIERQLDLRYVGMATELTVPVAEGDLTAETFHKTVDAFHEKHQTVYDYSYRGVQEVELVNLRVAAIGALERIKLPEEIEVEGRRGDGSEARVGERRVYLGRDEGFSVCPIYDRKALRAGDSFSGPAIVEQYDSTTFVPPKASVRVDRLSNLIMDLQ